MPRIERERHRPTLGSRQKPVIKCRGKRYIKVDLSSRQKSDMLRKKIVRMK